MKSKCSGFQKRTSLFTVFYFLMCTVMAPLAGAVKVSDDVMSQLSLGDLLNLEVSVATKTAMRMEEAPSIVSVITADEIKNMGARNLEDVLKTVPGFDMVHDPQRATHQVRIRGMFSQAHNNKTKVMLDGHSLSALIGSPQYTFNTIPMSEIKQIEIIRGPGSALYGTGAFLGVINIITHKGGEKASVLGIEGGSFDTIKTYGRVSYKKEDFKLSMYADYYDTEGYKERVDSDRFGTSPTSAAPGDTTNNSDSHTFKADISYNDFYFSGFFQKTSVEAAVGIVSALTDEDDSASTYAFGEFGYKTALTENGNLAVRAFYDYGEQDSLVEIFSEETAASVFKWTNNESIFGRPYYEASILGGEITVDYKIVKGVDLVAGTSYEYIDMFNVKHYASANLIGAPLDVGGITYNPMQYLGGMVDITENGNWVKESDRTVYSFYGQSVFDLKELFSLEKGVENLSFTAGLRYDDYDDFGNTLNPRFGLVYSPVSKLWFKALYGEAFRAPNFAELYAVNNPSRVGSPDLDPETITTVEGQIGYSFTENLKAIATIFNVKAENLIQADNKKYSNVGRMESKGLEAELRWHIDRQKYAYFNATYQDVKDTTNTMIRSAGGQEYSQKDFNPGGNPDIIVNFGINYDISKYVIANISTTYLGERDRTEEKKWDGENLVQVDDREPVKDCTLVNTSLTFKNFFREMEIQLSAYNLLDADYRNPDPSGYIKNDLPREGRNFMARISYSF